jgi:hypothetical protein
VIFREPCDVNFSWDPESADSTAFELEENDALIKYKLQSRFMTILSKEEIPGSGEF